MNNHKITSWYTHNFYAMGSHINIWVELDDIDTAEEILQKAESLFAKVETCLSRFNPDSELSHLNNSHETWMPVSPVLWRVLNKAVQLAEDTNGLFDPTLLNAMTEAGYTRSFEQLTDNVTDDDAVDVEDASAYADSCAHEQLQHHQTVLTGRWKEISLDPMRYSVWLPEGVNIDLGGIAKGWTAQQAVALLNQWGPCLVDAGGDLTAGDAPTTAGWAGWPVGVEKPYGYQADCICENGQHRTTQSSTANESTANNAQNDEVSDEESLFRLWLANCTLATSGVDYRRWQNNGQNTHHIIDPRSGRPAQTDLLIVSVLAPDASCAEAWATAAIVAGSRDGYQLLSQENIAAAFVQNKSIKICQANHDGQIGRDDEGYDGEKNSAYHMIVNNHDASCSHNTLHLTPTMLPFVHIEA
ncbi:MAG: FAD:protein FMN transferase [Chloroflexota bacterium]